MKNKSTKHNPNFANVSRFSKLNLTIFALIFVGLGSYFILSSHASSSLPSDINNDGIVDVTDLSLLLSSYGSNSAACVTNSSYTCDLDGNGKVDITDLSILLSNFGQSAPTVTLSASPTSVAAGNAVTVSWSNVANPTTTDWIGLYASGAADNPDPGNSFYDNSCTKTINSTSLASGSCSYTVPGSITAGTYEFRLFSNNTYTKLATSPAVTVTTSGALGVCGTPEPTGNVASGGHTWTLSGNDDFNKSAAVGSFASTSGGQVVYTGDQGMGWTEYPDGWPSTYSGGKEGYQPSTVQSVHDGVLDWYLHNDTSGNPVTANPSPEPGGNNYQTYGRYSFCEKIIPTTPLVDFYQAILLWPTLDSNYPFAESDYPEGALSETYDGGGYFDYFAHYGGSGAQDSNWTGTLDTSQWHVYTQEWGPGFRKYYVDGTLIGTSTNQVWSSPERWQFQVEPSGSNDGDTGHLYVDWAAVWTY